MAKEIFGIPDGPKQPAPPSEEPGERLEKRTQTIFDCAKQLAESLLNQERLIEMTGPPWNNNVFSFGANDGHLAVALRKAKEEIGLKPSEEPVFLEHFKNVCERGYPYNEQ
jgi:hypothetical protein